MKDRRDIEQHDVEKLEGRSLAAFFYNVIGKKEEKLEKEKREAYEAAVKYDAQEKIEKLQVELAEFKTELTDVNISADIKIEIDGFTKFADYFFDNIFTDWEVGGKIADGIAQVTDTMQSIKNVIEELEEMKNSNEEKMEELNKALEKIVLMEK